MVRVASSDAEFQFPFVEVFVNPSVGEAVLTRDGVAQTVGVDTDVGCEFFQGVANV